MHSADYAVERCLSVCPSGSHTILVFPYQTGWQYSDGNPLTGAPNARGYEKITIFDQYLALYRKWCNIEPYLLWKANRKPHQNFRMVPVRITLSDLELRFQGHDIIQRQITQKRYRIEPYLQWRTNRKSYMIYLTAPFSTTMNDPYPWFKVYHYLMLNISKTVRDRHSFNRIISRDLLKGVISNDLEWLSEIFNDTKRRAVSLRQLSYWAAV